MTVTMGRLRITFSKGGLLRYSGHLDLARAWERSLRRAGIPVAYSHGFNPRPRIQLAAALPLGHAGEAELLDVWLERPVAVGELARALQPALLEGLVVKEVREVPVQQPALPAQVAASEYEVAAEWEEPVERLQERMDRLLAETELRRQRRGKSYDLRPLIDRLWIVQEWSQAAGGPVLGMVLAARPGATGRPEAVLEALGLEGCRAQFKRLRLVLGQG
jgi:radical SAM-linked protein